MSSERIATQQDPIERVQNTLGSALGVRHRVSVLLDLAHEITLVALNGKITSAQIGDAGRAFSVMTNEITDIAVYLRATVTDIRRITHSWTRIIAHASQQMRRLKSLSEARANCIAKGRNVVAIDRAYQDATKSLAEFSQTYPSLLSELLAIIDGMEKSLMIVNYVKTGILVENARMRDGASGDRNSLEHLANEMQTASDSIREIAREAMERLRTLTSQPVLD